MDGRLQVIINKTTLLLRNVASSLRRCVKQKLAIGSGDFEC